MYYVTVMYYGTIIIVNSQFQSDVPYLVYNAFIEIVKNSCDYDLTGNIISEQGIHTIRYCDQPK